MNYSELAQALNPYLVGTITATGDGRYVGMQSGSARGLTQMESIRVTPGPVLIGREPVAASNAMLQIKSDQMKHLLLAYDDWHYARMNVDPGGILGITSTGNLSLNPLGGTVLPGHDGVSLGAPGNRWSAIYADHLEIQTIVSTEKIGSVNGRLMIGMSTALKSDVILTDVQITVGEAILRVGDFLYLKNGAVTEWMQVNEDKGGGVYGVHRNREGVALAADWVWHAGEIVFNTGTTDDGWIEEYSTTGTGTDQVGPTIAFNKRTGNAWNLLEEVAVIGNLNGYYDYTQRAYGVALGQYGVSSNTQPWIAVDSTNGVRIMRESTQLAKWDTSGNITIGGTSVGNLYLASNEIRMRFGTDTKFGVDSSGNLQMDGNLVMSQTSLIRGGKTSYADDATGGFWLGYDTSAWKMNFGMGSAYFKFDGVSASLSGVIYASAGSIGGWGIGSTSLTTGNVEISSEGWARFGYSGSDVVLNDGSDGSIYRLWVAGMSGTTAAFSVDSSGSMKATKGTIGGWYITDYGISSPGDGVQMNFLGWATFGSGDQILTLDGTDSQIYKLSIGDGTPANAPFRVDYSGSMYARDGTIAGWDLSELSMSGSGISLNPTGTIIAGSGNNVVYLSGCTSTCRIWVGHASAASATFRVSQTGALFSTSGCIAGWAIGTETLSSGNVSINQGGSITCGTGDDVAIMSGVDATWRLWIGDSTSTDAPFRVDKDGNCYATSFKTLSGTNSLSGDILYIYNTSGGAGDVAIHGKGANVGVWGEGAADGVYGSATGGNGVHGLATSGHGVDGEAGVGGIAGNFSGGDYGIQVSGTTAIKVNSGALDMGTNDITNVARIYFSATAYLYISGNDIYWYNGATGTKLN
jgi:hypothetical protein